MKKIVKLTESDLTRIVKRVLNEQETIGLAGIKSNNSGDDPSVGDVVTSLIRGGVDTCEDLTDFQTATFPSSGLMNAKKKGVIKDYSFSVKGDPHNGMFPKYDLKDDPYNYILLNNSKYCFHHSKDDTNKDWKEVTDPKAKSKIDLTIQKRKSK